MNKQVNDILRYLESHVFATKVNVASDLTTVRRIIGSEPAIRSLREACGRNGRVADRVLQNVGRLAARSVDPRYESPWDVALTAHLILLQDLDDASACLAATIVQRAPQTWWAQRQAAEILTSVVRRPRTKNMPVVEEC